MFMILFLSILQLFRARFEYLIAFVAARCELLIVTFAAVELFVLATEGLIDQRCFTQRAEETFLMPMSIFVGKIFGFGANLSSTFLARVSKTVFVAFNTVRMFIFEDVS